MPKESWTSQFRTSALKRIAEDEAFLEACGITPIAGAELEFHFAARQNATGYCRLDGITEFKHSGLVEELAKDETLFKVGEVVLGRGPQSHTGSHPRSRSPSTIARATRSTRNIISDGDAKYGMHIDFGEQGGKRIRSLQYNISLWNSTDKTPLFVNTPLGLTESGVATNALTVECARSLIEAQQALSALVSTGDASFERYKQKNNVFGIAVDNKSNQPSALIRMNKRGSPFVDLRTPHGLSGNPFEAHVTGDDKKEESSPPNNKRYESAQKGPPASLYFEDRLSSSEAEPALAMLITFGGMVKGVKTYMKNRGLVDENGAPDPEKLKAQINSREFSETGKISTDTEYRISAPWNYAFAIPKNADDALIQLEKSAVAKEVMGAEFHKDFCNAYKKAMLSASDANHVLSR